MSNIICDPIAYIIDYCQLVGKSNLGLESQHHMLPCYCQDGYGFERKPYSICPKISTSAGRCVLLLKSTNNLTSAWNCVLFLSARSYHLLPSDDSSCQAAPLRAHFLELTTPVKEKEVNDIGKTFVNIFTHLVGWALPLVGATYESRFVLLFTCKVRLWPLSHLLIGNVAWLNWLNFISLWDARKMKIHPKCMKQGWIAKIWYLIFLLLLCVIQQSSLHTNKIMEFKFVLLK